MLGHLLYLVLRFVGLGRGQVCRVSHHLVPMAMSEVVMWGVGWVEGVD